MGLHYVVFPNKHINYLDNILILNRIEVKNNQTTKKR